MANICVNEFHVGAEDSGVYRFCCIDPGLALFEKQYPLSDGMSYNSYIILDRKTVVVDTVDNAAGRVWRDALGRFLADKGVAAPDFLIVQHLEPDHSAEIEALMSDYPCCRLICSQKAASMLPAFAPGIDLSRITAVHEGETLDIGSRKLRFIMAPMVHWPEVMVTYDESRRLLFAADAFGTFGSTIAHKSSDSPGFAEAWIDEARRYYLNICGKFGAQVQALLKKASGLSIDCLCPLHGPVICPSQFNPVPLYDLWSRCEPEFPRKCVIAVASLHGFTAEAGKCLASMLASEGVDPVFIDLSEADLSEVVSEVFAAGATVFMSATYDASLVPSMRELLARLKSKGWQKRVAGIVENGSWSPIAARLIAGELEQMKGIGIVSPAVTIKTRLDHNSEAGLKELASSVASALKKNSNVD